jgi:hypothetical protein
MPARTCWHRTPRKQFHGQPPQAFQPFGQRFRFDGGSQAARGARALRHDPLRRLFGRAEGPIDVRWGRRGGTTVRAARRRDRGTAGHSGGAGTPGHRSSRIRPASDRHRHTCTSSGRHTVSPARRRRSASGNCSPCRQRHPIPAGHARADVTASHDAHRAARCSSADCSSADCSSADCRDRGSRGRRRCRHRGCCHRTGPGVASRSHLSDCRVGATAGSGFPRIAATSRSHRATRPLRHALDHTPCSRLSPARWCRAAAFVGCDRVFGRLCDGLGRRP